MNRQQKEILVGALKKSFDSSIANYVVGCQGLSVNAMRELRSRLRKHGAQVKVAKMRLVKRALIDNQELQGVVPFLCEQRGVVFVSHESTAVAKTLCDFAKEYERLQLVAGYVDREMLDIKGIEYLASLPSREVLLAQVLGTMQAPMRQCAVLLHLMLVRLAVVLQQIAQKKEQEA